MNIFQVTLELEGSRELAVTVLADGVTVHLTILLVEFYVVLHVVHESAAQHKGQVQETQKSGVSETGNSRSLAQTSPAPYSLNFLLGNPEKGSEN